MFDSVCWGRTRCANLPELCLAKAGLLTVCSDELRPVLEDLTDTTSFMSTMVAEARVSSQQGQHIHGVGRHAARERLS